MYYFQGANILSLPLEAGTEAHRLVCQFLELSETATVSKIRKAFGNLGWHFSFSGTQISEVFASDDNEIPDPDNLLPIAAAFTPESYIEYTAEDDDFPIRSIFRDETIHSETSDSRFSPDGYLIGDLPHQISCVEDELRRMKTRWLLVQVGVLLEDGMIEVAEHLDRIKSSFQAINWETAEFPIREKARIVGHLIFCNDCEHYDLTAVRQEIERFRADLNK